MLAAVTVVTPLEVENCNVWFAFYVSHSCHKTVTITDDIVRQLINFHEVVLLFTYEYKFYDYC
jgi:hypothetical protein